MPPKLIAGRYRVEREVGRGGMGSVWLCRDERLGRSVAVKQVGGLPGESSMHLARALREARHSAALNHPNVVAIFDAIEDGNQVWLVMEYVPGRTLDQMVREDGPLEPHLVASIGADVADGLAAAHALGTVHRDVKPSNILVRGGDGRALIADFGIARTVGQEQLTRSGLVTGTPVYFAPELARGQEPSRASDVWALGVSLYVAVEGKPPYPDQSNAIALLNVIASQPTPEPTRAGPLTDVMRQMLDPEPETRCTMRDAAGELHRVAADAPARTQVMALADPVPTPVRTSGPSETPHDTPIQTAYDAPPAAPPPPPDTVPTRTVVPASGGRRPALLALTALVLLALVGLGGWWLTRDTDQPIADPPNTVKHSSRASARAGSPQPSSSASASRTPEPSPTSEAPPTSSAPATSAATSAAAQPSPSGASARSATQLVADYYGLLPDNTDAAWSLLTPELQRHFGADNYRAFWATIDDVQVNGTRTVGDGIVQVSLTYVTDGRSEQETRQLGVERSGDGYLISDDMGAVQPQ